jgi:hypothetical protein
MGAFFWGAPIEIGALLTSSALLFPRRVAKAFFFPTLIATSGYAAMILAFFVLNLPVNAAVNTWMIASLPANWPDCRLRWEAGHALAAFGSIVALVALGRSMLTERDAGSGGLNNNAMAAKRVGEKP